jgi:hypothetical protein
MTLSYSIVTSATNSLAALVKLSFGVDDCQYREKRKGKKPLTGAYLIKQAPNGEKALYWLTKHPPIVYNKVQQNAGGQYMYTSRIFG